MATVEKSAWSAEEVERIVFEVVEAHLQDAEYDEDLVSQWVNWICEESSRRLIELKKPFKYIVQAAVLQRTGAGIHVTSCCFWNPAEDGVLTCLWPRERLQTQERKGGAQACVMVYAAKL